MPYKKARKGKTGMTVVYSGDSSVLIKKDGTIVWRNNNPGNIVCGFKSKTNGAIGCSNGFSIFTDIETGRKAQVELLKRDYYQGKTIAKAMAKYAEPKHNDTERYIQYVTKKTGMPRDKKLANMTSQEFNGFTNAIRRYENLTSGTETTLPPPDRALQLLRSSRGSSQGSSAERTLKRVGETIYRIEKGRIVGSFTCHGK